VLPSEVAKRNMWFCMIEEPLGIKYRHDFRVDHILWESDYPHADTPFPNTQSSVKVQFEGVPEAEIEQMTHENAEALFKFPLSQRLIEQYATV
jgi:predicted TIM-barrel fold metal-dependent hydrolase